MADKRNTGPARRKARSLPQSRVRNPGNKVKGHGPLKTKWERGKGYPQRSGTGKRASNRGRI